MNWKKNRLVLAVVALVVLGGAVFSTLRSNESAETAKDDVTLPKVDKDAVDALELVRPGKETVKLAKQGESWKMVAPVAADADESAVTTALDKLADLEVTGVAARRKANHGKLEVDDEKGVVVTAKKGDEVLASLVVGASRSAGTMVREKDKEAVVSVKGAIRYAFDKDVKLFRDRKILDEKEESVTALHIESEQGTFKFTKGEDWAQAEGEKAIEDFAASKVKGIASALARLRAADFAAADATPEQTGLATPTATAVVSLKPEAEGGEARTITLKLGKQNDGGREYYVQREGVEQVYLVSKYTAERLLAKAEDFAQKESEAAEAPANPTPTPTTPSQLPPDVMRQLQQQLQQQGGRPPGHP